MSDIAIKVEDLSKLYQLGTIGTGTLKNDISRWWARARGQEDPFAKIGQVNDRTQKATSDFVWALKDINFEVKKGDVLGIIGKNGAGKSTLLKILSKITSPTSGKIKVDGRIASLLEVGTGFHPDLSGRDNIYMNGAILGMRKWEIQKKFEEIVDFSGVEAYIDTPVKRYSSGMYVRLAFAVAAFLEPEILIVDEVLAVGDSEFQKKCLGRMKDVSVNDGRTVLFVSHNMAAVRKLCTNGLLMKDGFNIKVGEINEVLDRYLKLGEKNNSVWLRTESLNSEISITQIRVVNSFNELSNTISLGEDFSIEITIESNSILQDATIAIQIESSDGVPVLTTNLHDNDHESVIDKGCCTYKAIISKNILMSGSYTFTVACFVTRKKLYDLVQNAVAITIEDLSLYNSDLDRKGYVRPIFKWEKHEV